MVGALMRLSLELTMGDVCGKEDSNHDVGDSRMKLVKFIGNFMPKMVNLALQDAYNKLNDGEVVVHGPGKEPKSRQKVNKTTLTFELQGFTSELKASFQKTLFSLDLFERYCEGQSDETAKPLKQLFNRGKTACMEFFSTEKILNFLPSSVKSDIQNYFNSEKPTTENIEEKEYKDKKQNSAEIGDHEKKNPALLMHINQSSWKVLSSKAEISDEHDSIDQSLVKRRRKEVAVRKIPDDYPTVEDEEIDRLMCEIKYLHKQLELLKNENQDILAVMGEIIVEKNVKESNDKKSANFQRIYRPLLPEGQRSIVGPCHTKPVTGHNRLGYPNDSRIHDGGSSASFYKIDDRSDNAMAVSTDSSVKEPVLGAMALVPANNHEKLTNEDQISAGISRITNNFETQNPGVQISSKASGGDRIDEAGRVEESCNNLSFSVQQDYLNGGEFISLCNVPSTSVAKTLYNNYKMLLLCLGQMLLSTDVMELKNWANDNFSIIDAHNATDVLLQLDEKQIINASNLSPLRVFFESIGRFDLVHIIDTFLLGDYSLLHQTAFPTKRNGNNSRNPQRQTRTRYSSFFNELTQLSHRSSGVARRNEASSGSTAAGSNATNLTNEGNGNSEQSLSKSKNVFKFPNENQSTTNEQQSLKPIANAVNQFSAHVVADGPAVINERRRTTGNPTNSSAAKNSFGSNGSKQSKHQRPVSSNQSNSFASDASRSQDLEDDGNWLCSHYKRRCLVKFECCDKFWPCHRCHNNQSSCGRKKLKSRDTKLVKCVSCFEVQEFGEFCRQCGVKFANYFCGLCKHLTGNDDHPYHCEKCGICRIHGDRSFHCDVCGVCLDVQLLGNHKCREGSAHDECCICLEDAFTGCQILPCSHKVHKECATQMIRSGITRCPICRESFAHKLERRPLSSSRKRGK